MNFQCTAASHLLYRHDVNEHIQSCSLSPLAVCFSVVSEPVYCIHSNVDSLLVKIESMRGVDAVLLHEALVLTAVKLKTCKLLDGEHTDQLQINPSL